MILYYTSSDGQSYNLKCGKLRTRTASYHTYDWTPQTVKQRYGEKVYRFDKSAIVYTTLISVFGTQEERRMQLNRLHSSFNYDIDNLTFGRITHGEYYIDCFITASNTYYENPYTQNEINIYCPYPFWKHDIKHSFTPDEAKPYPFLDYPHGYNYDFKAKLPARGVLENSGERSANYTLTIYGAATNPRIVINDLEIGVNATIGSAEKVVIDTGTRTVVKYGAVETNLFNNRIKGEKSMFAPIPVGVSNLLWNGTFDFDLVLHEERSEPLWI